MLRLRSGCLLVCLSSLVVELLCTMNADDGCATSVHCSMNVLRLSGLVSCCVFEGSLGLCRCTQACPNLQPTLSCTKAHSVKLTTQPSVVQWLVRTSPNTHKHPTHSQAEAASTQTNREHMVSVARRQQPHCRCSSHPHTPQAPLHTTTAPQTNTPPPTHSSSVPSCAGKSAVHRAQTHSIIM